jgi:photosystem II stability/assembly factor-like uncharacterized protein
MSHNTAARAIGWKAHWATLLWITTATGLAAHSDYGVLQSTDGGKTWQKVLDGTAVIDSMASGEKGQLVAATAGYLSGPGMEYGIYYAARGATHWTKAAASDMPPGNVDIRSLLSVSGPEIIAAGGAGVHSSSDGGATWKQLSSPMPGVTFQALAKSSQGTLLAGASDGVYQSRDGGSHWIRLGLKGKNITSLLVAPNGQLLAGTVRDGLFSSSSSGRSWTPASSLSASTVSALGVDKAGHVYAGIVGRGILKSDDGGRTWVSTLSLGKNTATYALSVGAGGEIYAAAGECCPVNAVYLFRSRDGGKAWERILRVADGVAIGAIVATVEGTVFVGLTTVGE